MSEELLKKALKTIQRFCFNCDSCSNCPIKDKCGKMPCEWD